MRQSQRPLQLHHPVVEADEAPALQSAIGTDMVVAVIVVFRGPAKKFGVVHDQHPTLTGGQGLDRIEGKGADGPEGPQVLTSDKSPGGLGRIFNNRQVVPAGDFQNRLNIRLGSQHMHRNDGPGPGGNFLFQVLRIHIQGVVDFGEHWYGPGLQYGFPGGHKSETGGNDLVPEAHAEAAKATLRAVLPEETARACFRPVKAAKAFSNSSTL